MQQWFRNDAKFIRKECLPAGKTLSKHSVQFWEGVFRLSDVLVRPETIEKEAILPFFITFKQQLVSVDNGTGQVGLSRPIKSSFSVWRTTGCCQGGFRRHKPQVSTVKPAPAICILRRLESPVRACMCAKLLQSWPTLCNSVDSSPPGSSVHGVLQARILEWVTMPFSRGPCQPKHWTQVSYVSCFGRQGLHH